MLSRLRILVLTTIVLALLLNQWNDSKAATPSKITKFGQLPHGNNAAEILQARNTDQDVIKIHSDLSMLMAQPGTFVRIPQLAADRLQIPEVQTVPALSSSTRQHILTALAGFLPCGNQVVDEVVVLRHPSSVPADPSFQRDHFLAGVVSIGESDGEESHQGADVPVRLYLFLPQDLLDGSGLYKPLTCTNIIPYAGAPTPETLGHFLTWTIAHESWHLLDAQARFAQIRSDDSLMPANFSQAVADPQRWSRAYAEIPVANFLGWKDFGESYAMSDELAGSYTMRAGHTTYGLTEGVLQIAYTDDRYSFKRPMLRTGYLPSELQTLSDLQRLLESGRYPTLYGLFNSEEERFAEYGAWYLYSNSVGGADQFQALFPKLADAYSQRWQAANNRCLDAESVVMTSSLVDQRHP